MTTQIKGNDTSTFGGAIDANNINVTGNILQVVSTTKTDTFSTTSTSYVDITGLSVSITPTSTSSKIFIKYFRFKNL